MKTAKIHGLKLRNPARDTQKLRNAQTRVTSQFGAPQPVMQNKIEPAVFDIQYIKGVWNKLVNFLKK